MNIVTRGARYASVDLLLDSGYLWLARDLNGSIAAYSHKPFKLDDEVWRVEEGESKEMWMWVDDGDLYNFVKWEDDEPVNIREWFKKEEEEMKLYYVRNGQLESKDVDATNGIVALGVNDVVELDRDNKIVTDGATIQVSTRNSGKSAILEKAKEIREALEMAKDYRHEPLVSIVANQFEYRHEPLDAKLINKIVSGIDVNRDIDYRPITLDDLNNVQIHGAVCQELYETYKKKNADYGNSFENSLDKHGLIAGIIRMDDKMSRLISLNSKNEQQVMDESLRDTLMDLANYTIMSVMWLDEQ